jgi:tetratricopeptide (TPR) repeat protein
MQIIDSLIRQKGYIGCIMFRLPILLSMLIACLFLIQNPIFADEETYIRQMGGKGITEQELNRLPKACIAKERGTPDEKAMWHETIGGAFTHLAHYCEALNALNRIDRGVGDRNALLQAALGGFQYMQHQMPEDSALRPEVEYHIGLVLHEMDRTPEAIVPLRKAILIKPDYVQAYLLLSRCYKQIGNAARAAEVLQEGLVKMRDSQALQSALNDLTATKQESGKGKP